MHGYKWPINCTRTRTASTLDRDTAPAAAEGFFTALACATEHDGHCDAGAGIDEIMHMCAYLSYGILIYNMMCLQGVHLFLDTLVHLQ